MKSRKGIERSRESVVPPRIRLERTWADHLLDGSAFAGLLVSWVVLLATWSELPESVPRHYSMSGDPDAWGPRALLFLLPSIGVVSFFILLRILRIPHLYRYPWTVTADMAPNHYRRARRLLQALNVVIQWFFFGIVWQSIQIAMKRPSEWFYLLTPLFLIAIFSLIIVYVIFGNRFRTEPGDSS